MENPRPSQHDEFSEILIRTYCLSEFVDQDRLSREISFRIERICSEMPKKKSVIKRKFWEENIFGLVFFGSDREDLLNNFSLYSDISLMMDDLYNEVKDYILLQGDLPGPKRAEKQKMIFL